MCQVPDEEEIRRKAEQIAVEYEKKMQKMSAELAEARASSERTAAEMDRLRAESEAKQRQLYADFTVQSQSQRVQLQQQFDTEMERVRRELESTRRSKELVQTEMNSLRHEYESAMFAVENSVPPQELAAERERLRVEYETNMKFMRDELDAVKTSRASVETEMQQLKAEYESRLSVDRSTMSVANASTSTGLLPVASDKLRHHNLTDEMKIVVSTDCLTQTDDGANVTEQLRSGSDLEGTVPSKLMKESLSKYSSTSQRSLDRQEEPKVDSKLSPIDINQLQKDASFNHEAAVVRINSELEGFKKSRDELAEIIFHIKTDYQDAVRSAEQTAPGHKLDLEKHEIREKHELQMDHVKDDLKVLKTHRHIVTLQLTEQTSAWKIYEDERQRIDEDVKAGRVEKQFAPVLIQAAAQKYLEESLRLESVAAADKEKIQIKVISERFEREKQNIKNEAKDGKLTETEASNQLDRLIKAKNKELSAVREQRNNHASASAAVVEDVDEMNVNTKSSMSQPLPRTGAWSSQHEVETGDAVTRRLKTLEDILLTGGHDITGGGTGLDVDHCRFIREKLHREKRNAEERQRQLQEATKKYGEENVASELYNVFSSAHEEIVAKTTALRQLQYQNETLRREIGDVQVDYKQCFSV